ncbi:hypothetical protein [Dictyobacter kobayashii]|uniref:Uncharacterized protein n=1 Tax=Dictyobacter kobayashii TaxID=2014872 RepID=A0A402AFQ4_9CHLR|nr:hypothetical protein [Dictyobacter kobayashii]GCE17894.1 hypothetical protein KDK_16940 [Dictyobacter kobayashii]
MAPQMDSQEQRPNPAAYQGYEGTATAGRDVPPYEREQAAYGQPVGTNKFEDDNFVEAVAQRLGQRLTQNQDFSGKLHQPRSSRPRASAGQRLALAIVSLGVLIPISSDLMQNVGSAIGFGMFFAACGAIVLINLIFNL